MHSFSTGTCFCYTFSCNHFQAWYQILCTVPIVPFQLAHWWKKRDLSLSMAHRYREFWLHLTWGRLSIDTTYKVLLLAPSFIGEEYQSFKVGPWQDWSTQIWKVAVQRGDDLSLPRLCDYCGIVSSSFCGQNELWNTIPRKLVKEKARILSLFCNVGFSKLNISAVRALRTLKLYDKFHITISINEFLSYPWNQMLLVPIFISMLTYISIGCAAR